MQKGLGNIEITRNGRSVNKFNSNLHAKCWRRYNVRPKGNSPHPEITDQKYCIYDEPHNDYLYTQEWVEFLITKLSDDNEYESFFKKKIK